MKNIKIAYPFSLIMVVLFFLIACEEEEGIPSATGILAINIVGLPDGAEASVDIVGPNNFTQTLTNTSSITTGIGTYSFKINRVTIGGDQIFLPVLEDTLTLVRSGAETTLDIAYERVFIGDLNLTINGIADGSAKVTVTGPADFQETYTGSGLKADLLEGTYNVFVEIANDGTDNYIANLDETFGTFEIVNAQATDYTVTYHGSVNIGSDISGDWLSTAPFNRPSLVLAVPALTGENWAFTDGGAGTGTIGRTWFAGATPVPRPGGSYVITANSTAQNLYNFNFTFAIGNPFGGILQVFDTTPQVMLIEAFAPTDANFTLSTPETPYTNISWHEKQ